MESPGHCVKKTKLGDFDLNSDIYQVTGMYQTLDLKLETCFVKSLNLNCTDTMAFLLCRVS